MDIHNRIARLQQDSASSNLKPVKITDVPKI